MINGFEHAVANCFFVARVKVCGQRNERNWRLIECGLRRAVYRSCTAKFAGVWRRDAENVRLDRRTIIVIIITIISIVAVVVVAMNCYVKPLKKYAEISYQVKYVTVENERVFGDVYVTQQTRDLACHLPDASGSRLRSLRRKRNLVQQSLYKPDFMELNSSKSSINRIASSSSKRRTKSTGDSPSAVAFNYEKAGKADGVIKKPKVNVRATRLKIDWSPGVSKFTSYRYIGRSSLNRHLLAPVGQCWHKTLTRGTVAVLTNQIEFTFCD